MPLTPAPREFAPHYWCFLTYRPADDRAEARQWASWLHQSLEAYEVPADLVGMRNQLGEVIPERLTPIFREEGGSPADSRLDSPIHQALDRSSALIVLCSPRAALSASVENAVRYFKQIGRAHRVLAALLEGEPNASWDLGKLTGGTMPDQECLPKSLLHPVDASGRIVTSEYIDPIVADFRLPGSARQGWTTPEAHRRALANDRGLSARELEERLAEYRRQCELAKLKLIAGILAIPFAQLSRHRRVAAASPEPPVA